MRGPAGALVLGFEGNQGGGFRLRAGLGVGEVHPGNAGFENRLRLRSGAHMRPVF